MNPRENLPPNGRRNASSLTEVVREVTLGGRTLVEFHNRMMLDERARNGDRLTAAAWLGDRGFGKAVGLDVLVKVDATKAAGSLPTLDTAVLEALVSGTPMALTSGHDHDPSTMVISSSPAGSDTDLARVASEGVGKDPEPGP